MQPTSRFTRLSGGLIAPADLYRPRRNSRPRPVTTSGFTLDLVVDVDDLDQGWTASVESLSDRPAA